MGVLKERNKIVRMMQKGIVSEWCQMLVDYSASDTLKELGCSS